MLTFKLTLHNLLKNDRKKGVRGCRCLALVWSATSLQEGRGGVRGRGGDANESPFPPAGLDLDFDMGAGTRSCPGGAGVSWLQHAFCKSDFALL